MHHESELTLARGPIVEEPINCCIIKPSTPAVAALDVLC